MNSAATVSVSVVIPTWNGLQLLTECLSSLRMQETKPAEIIVVDDGSTDGTCEMVQSDFPEARAIMLPENRGFCGAVNAGIAAAKSDWLFLLNNDMTLKPDCIGRLIARATAGADMVAPLVLWRDEPDVIYSAGDIQRRNGRPESVGFLSKVAGFEMPREVFGISAGAGLYRRAMFERIGAFDEAFNIYFSDSDLNFRARLAGYTAALASEAVAWHVGSAHLSGRTWKRTRQCYINHMMLLVKNMPGPLLVRYAPEILAERLHQARRVFSAMRAESGAVTAARELAAAWLDMARMMPHAVRQRRRIQRLRTVAPRDLRDMLRR